jgi:hypothetical protein
LVHPDQFSPGFNELRLGGVVETDLGRRSHGNLLEAADAGPGATHIPKVPEITIILQNYLNFYENLKKGR